MTDDLKLVERLRAHHPYNQSPHGDGPLVREAADAIERLVRERGSDTGHDCDICRQRIFGAMIGNGDGSGQRFAHPDCYYRRRNNEAEADRDRLAKLVAEMREVLRAERLELIAAWEALPGGRNQPVRAVERWLLEDMAPVINARRSAIKAETTDVGS